MLTQRRRTRLVKTRSELSAPQSLFSDGSASCSARKVRDQLFRVRARSAGVRRIPIPVKAARGNRGHVASLLPTRSCPSTSACPAAWWPCPGRWRRSSIQIFCRACRTSRSRLTILTIGGCPPRTSSWRRVSSTTASTGSSSTGRFSPPKRSSRSPRGRRTFATPRGSRGTTRSSRRNSA